MTEAGSASRIPTAANNKKTSKRFTRYLPLADFPQEIVGWDYLYRGFSDLLPYRGWLREPLVGALPTLVYCAGNAGQRVLQLFLLCSLHRWRSRGSPRSVLGVHESQQT